ncbi:MAG: hypothetical protein WBA68_04970 [Alteraurantiacibacter sp.]
MPRHRLSRRAGAVNYGEVFGRGELQSRAAPKQRVAPVQQSTMMTPPPSVAGDSDAMDDAIARALENCRRTGSFVGNPA